MSKESALAMVTGNPPPAEAPKIAAVPDVEAKATEGTTAEPVKDELVSTRIAQIAKKEAKYREEQESFKKQMAEFQDRESKFKPFYEKYRQFEEMKAKDPVAAIKLLGFTDTDYINFVAAQEDKSTPEEKAAKIAEAKIAEFKAQQDKEKQEEETRRNEESISAFKKNIAITVKANAERFELCNHYGEEAQALILEKVQSEYTKALETDPNAEPLSAEAAADLVEKDFEAALEELRSLKKFNKQKEAETAEENPVAKKIDKEEPLKAEVKPGMPPRTLTNKVAPAAAPAAPKRESPNEKRERLKRWLATGVKP